MLRDQLLLVTMLDKMLAEQCRVTGMVAIYKVLVEVHSVACWAFIGIDFRVISLLRSSHLMAAMVLEEALQASQGAEGMDQKHARTQPPPARVHGAA